MGDMTVDDDRFASACLFAVTRFNETGELLPMIHAHSKFGADYIFGLTFASAEEQDQQLATLRAHFMRHQVEHYIVMNEGWMYIGKPGEDCTQMAVRPSEHPERREVVIIASVSYQRSRIRTFVINRSGSKPVLEEMVLPSAATAGGGKFMTLLPP